MKSERQLIDVAPFAEQLTSIINENRQRFKNIPAMQEVIDLLEMAKGYALNQPIVEAIPITVMKRKIEGIGYADQGDQAGRYDLELRHALKTVLKWYESPSYKECERSTYGK